MIEPLALNERFALKDIVEWPREIPYNFRAAITGSPDKPSSMETLCAKGLVYIVDDDPWGNPCYRPTPEGYDRYFADDLEDINFRKLYPRRRPTSVAGLQLGDEALARAKGEAA